MDCRQSPKFVDKIDACRFFRDGDGQKCSGLEPAAELLGQAGQFHGVANGLVPVVQFPVASEQPIDDRLCLRTRSSARAR